MRQNREIQNSLYKVCLQNHEQHYHVSECVECEDLFCRGVFKLSSFFSKRVKPPFDSRRLQNLETIARRTANHVLRESKKKRERDKKKRKRNIKFLIKLSRFIGDAYLTDTRPFIVSQCAFRCNTFSPRKRIDSALSLSLNKRDSSIVKKRAASQIRYHFTLCV